MLDHTAELIAKIATALSGTIGARFFESLVGHLAEALSADHALAGERKTGNPACIKTLAAFSDGRLVPGFEYELTGTPCEELLHGSTTIHPADVTHQFPQTMLVELGAQAYAGTSLIGSDGKVLGVLAVFWRRPLADSQLAKSMLELFAGRASSELERKQAEDALRESERRRQEFNSNSGEGVWQIECDPPVPLSLPPEEVLDRFLRQSRFTELNDMGARMAGAGSAAQLIGVRLLDWPGVEAELDRLRQHAREGFPVRRVRFQTRNRDGEVRWFERNEVPIVENGNLLQISGTTLDLTAHQHAQEALQESGDRYRTLFEGAGDAIFLLRDGVVDCNSRALEIFGATREQLMGQTSWSLSPEFQPDGSNSKEKCLEKALLLDGGETLAFEWRHHRMNGECFDAEVTLSPVTIGGVNYRVSLVEDITGRKQAEAQLRNLRADLERLVAERTAQLEAANQEMEAFSYAVSHHLRTAIHGISQCSQTVLDDFGDKLNADGRQWLEHIHADTQELEKLTLALLELSQVSRANLDRRLVDLSGLARSTAQRLAQADRDRKAEFRIASGLAVNADPVLMRVVLENLLSNAWKFSKPRDVAEIEFGERDGAFYVSDNGVGFDMRYAGKLFGAFQRLHRADEFEGTGIGLATVRRVIHRHGGRVWAQGAVGKGATIMFTMRSGQEQPLHGR